LREARRFFEIRRIAEEAVEPSGSSAVHAEARAAILQLIAALKVAGIDPDGA
jgi:hypothetical protein